MDSLDPVFHADNSFAETRLVGTVASVQLATLFAIQLKEQNKTRIVGPDLFELR